MILPDAEFDSREAPGPATPGERSASGPFDAARGIFNGAILGILLWVVIFAMYWWLRP